MHVTALPAGLRRFTLADLPRERWRNGAGWTRTVASAASPDCAGPDAPPAWRVSLAEISQGAPFSRFPGLDRIAVLVKGGPVLLRGSESEPDSPTRAWPLTTPGDLVRFAGEAPMENAAPEREALIWNVMARRGSEQAEVLVYLGQRVTLPPTGHSLIWVLHGSFHVVTGSGRELFMLAADEGLHQSGAQPGLVLVPSTPDAALVRTHLR